MKNNDATEKSLCLWLTVTQEINLAYGRVLSENYKNDNQITFNACVKWLSKMESIFVNIKNPVYFYDEYMFKIGVILKKIENNMQIHKFNKSLIVPTPIQLEQNNFQLWFNSLQMVLCAEKAIEAIEFSLNAEHPKNLIARGRILQSIPEKLKTKFKQFDIAYKMMQVLRKEYDNDFLQLNNLNVSKKRKLYQLNQMFNFRTLEFLNQNKKMFDLNLNDFLANGKKFKTTVCNLIIY